jgi:hypothetical protein
MKKSLTFLSLATVSLSLLLSPKTLAVKPLTESRNPNVTSVTQLNSTEEIDVSSISIGRLKIGMTTKEITNLLGKPNQRSLSNSCIGSTTTLKYRKLVIDLLDEKIISISTSSKLYATEKGVRIGDPISKAKRIYSKFKSEKFGNEQLSFFNRNDNGRLSFSAKKGKITNINLLSTSC